MVKSLAEIDARPGALTPERAAAWQRDLLELLNHGKDAVPALAEFFQKNQDVRFDSEPDANLLGEPTLRIALIKSLFDIPAPDNVQLQEQVLRTTADPAEIALLARQLEMQEPGKHRDAIMTAATAALGAARTGNAPARDTSLMIKLLKEFDDPDAK